MLTHLLSAGELPDLSFLVTIGFWVIGALVLLILVTFAIGLRYIPNNRVGIVEKLWSGSGFAVRAAMIAQNAATSRLKHTAVSE